MAECALVSVTFPDIECWSHDGHFVDKQTHERMARDLEAIAGTNSYGGLTLRVRPCRGEHVDRYRAVMLAERSYYQGLAVESATVQFQLDVIDAFSRKGLDLTRFERVIYMAVSDDTEDPNQCTGAVLPFPAGTNGFWVVWNSYNSEASGFWHEIGHTFGERHSGCAQSAQPSASPGVTYSLPASSQLIVYGYGDPFDYISLGGGCAPRFRVPAQFQPGQENAAFAAETAIHAHPLRKVQQGWLDDRNVRTVEDASSQTYIIESVATTPREDALYAIEIPRGFESKSGQPSGQALDARSLIIYYRGNEPLARDGVQVALFSRYQLGRGTEVIEFPHGLPIIGPTPCSGCYAGPAACQTGARPCAGCTKCGAPDATRFPCGVDDLEAGQESWVTRGVLAAGESLHDPVSGATITVCKIVTNTRAVVQVSGVGTGTTGTDRLLHRHIPIALVTSKKIQESRFLGAHFGIEILDDLEIKAYDPDFGAPGRPLAMWDGIRSVTIKAFGAGGEGQGQQLELMADRTICEEFLQSLGGQPLVLNDPSQCETAPINLSEASVRQVSGMEPPYLRFSTVFVEVESDFAVQGVTRKIGASPGLFVYATKYTPSVAPAPCVQSGDPRRPR